MPLVSRTSRGTGTDVAIEHAGVMFLGLLLSPMIAATAHELEVCVGDRERTQLRRGISMSGPADRPITRSVRDDNSGLPWYTRTVSSRQFVSASVLVILTALPVSGSVCALLCDAARGPMMAGHHGAAKDCEEPASTSSAQIRGVSEHDCSRHDPAIQKASLAAAEKTSASVTSIPLVANLVTVTFTAPFDAASDPQYASPPGTAPPTTTPLVLRI